MIGMDVSAELSYRPENVVFLKSYAALLGVAAMIWEDGRASMCYTPDLDSAHYGYNEFTGDVGLGLYGYLRGVRAEARQLFRRLGSPTELVGFGCDMSASTRDRFDAVIKDGVGQWFRHHDRDVEVRAERGLLRRVNGARDKRDITIEIENPWVEPLEVVAQVRGLWGKRFSVQVNDGPATIQEAASGMEPGENANRKPGLRLAATVPAGERVTFRATLVEE